MQKEIVIAIIFGGFLGLVVAFGIWRVNVSLKNESDKTNVGNLNSEEIHNDKSDLTLSISSPSDKSVMTEEPVEVAGITKSGAFVLISGNEEDQIVTSDKNGEFRAQIGLVGGINHLNILSYSHSDRKSVSSSIKLVFSTLFDKEQDSKSNESSSIEKVVSEKIDRAKNMPKAYFGTITDISEGSIQIRSQEGEIRQAAISSETTYANIVKATKEISFSDLAIGDFIVAMGLTNNNEILDAKRVLVTTSNGESEKMLIDAEIIEKNGSKISVRKTNGEEIFFSMSKNSRVFLKDKDGGFAKSSVSEIESGDIVLCSLIKNEDTYVANSVFIIERPE